MTALPDRIINKRKRKSWKRTLGISAVVDTISYALERCAEILTLRVPEKKIKRTTLTFWQNRHQPLKASQGRDEKEDNSSQRMGHDRNSKTIIFINLPRSLELTPDHPKINPSPSGNKHHEKVLKAPPHKTPVRTYQSVNRSQLNAVQLTRVEEVVR